MRVDIGEFCPPPEASRLDQLTLIRNYVREQFTLHENATELQVLVFWQNGDGEDMVFDKSVGYPLGTDEKFWFKYWTDECGL